MSFRLCLALAALAACAPPATAPIGNAAAPSALPVPRTDLSCDGSLAAAGIHGIVTDRSTGSPLEGVTVRVRTQRGDPGASITTDETGCYFLGDLPAGKHSIDFIYLDIALGKLTELALGRLQRLDGQIPVEAN